MAERAFPRAFRRLVGAFHRYHDVPREPDRVREMAGARIELDDARAEARLARDRHFVDPPTPDFVEPGLGTDSRTIAGKVAAVLFAVIAVGAVVVGAWALSGIGTRPVEVVDGTFVEELVPTSAGVCRWDVSADLRNTTDETIVIRSARAETVRGRATLVQGGIELPADTVTPVEMSFVLPNRCPSGIDALAPGQIRVNGEFSIRP